MERWLVSDSDGEELIFKEVPYRGKIFDMWFCNIGSSRRALKNGSQEKICGRKINWKDEPFLIEIEPEYELNEIYKMMFVPEKSTKVEQLITDIGRRKKLIINKIKNDSMTKEEKRAIKDTRLKNKK